MALLLGFVVSAVTGPADGILTHALPISLRAPLIASIGAVIAVSPILAVGGKMISPVVLMVFAVSGSLSTGACSLLAHSYRSKTANAASIRHSLS